MGLKTLVYGDIDEALRRDVAEYAMFSAQLAALLEVSGFPKPGNVHRTRDFPDTRYEHFLAGAVALGSAVEKAALQGVKAGKGEIEASGLGLGRWVKKAVSDVRMWHKGGNTHLGTCLLFIPLAAAYGKTRVEDGEVNLLRLMGNVDLVTRVTTPEDAVDVYDAVLMLNPAGKLGRVKGAGRAPDLYSPDAMEKLLGDRVSLFEVMEAASSWDSIAEEWVTGMNVSFTVGYPTFTGILQRTGDVNVATVHTFLTILAKVPDTFTARKTGLMETPDVRRAVEVGREKIRWVSETASYILEMGGLTTEDGRKALNAFDERLHEARGKLSPGTTADLTASSIMVALLRGLRF